MKPSLLNISKTMAFATAIGAASAAWATQYLGVLPGSTDFENIEPWPDSFMTVPADATAEIIQETPSVATRPANYYYAGSNSVLSVDADLGTPVLRNLETNAVATTLSDETTVYLDMLVKPSAVVAAGAASPTPGQNDQLLIFFRENGSETNLCVVAGGCQPNQNGVPSGRPVLATNEYVLTSSVGITAGEWKRIVVVAANDVGIATDPTPGYNIYFGGYDPDDPDGPDYLCHFSGTVGEDTVDDATGFFSLTGAGTITSVGFAGSGCVDDFVASTNDPDQRAELAPNFTLTWPEVVTPVSYTVGGETTMLSGASSPLAINVQDGAVVAFTFTNADGATKTMTATASSSVNEIDAEDAVWGWSDYLGDAVSGAYTIDDANDLDMLRKGVDAGLATSNETFRQTANIDMTSAGAFAGIGAAGQENGATLTALAFEGTYDGGNYTISNITFTVRKGSALFNLVRGATIKDLVVDTVSYESTFNAAKQGGAMIVGNGVNCTLQHLVTLGSNGYGNPCTYNAAGIANRLEGRGGPVLVIGCTNNAAIYCVYSKVAGICPIVQGADQPVTFVDCANTGTIVADGTATQIALAGKAPGEDGAAGIVAYSQGANNVIELSFTNCVNTGTITSNTNKTCIASIFAKTTASGITLVGGSAQADIKSVNTGADKVTGAKFATVDGNVATFVADDALAAGNTYKVMAGNATATYEFTAPGSISFNTALATPTYAITSSGLAGNVTSATEAPVTTYTAGYFPRTATAGQDGTAEHPFEIADLDDLQALQYVVANAPATYAGLSYVQKADIALTNVWEGIGMKGGKDHVSEAAYNSEAFTGVYDGGNYTISNFQMESGTDYGALFNSVYNATIKNLKISYKENKLTPISDTNDGSTGASFVGVAKSSTLQNLTAVAGTVTNVWAYKDMGGIVGYLMAGSTVESCTNELNVASTKGGRKCGGIAIITQGGSGTATIRNCMNSGTSAGGAQDGGIVGYVGTTTAIIGCENTANAPLLTCQDNGEATVSGGTKSVANRAAFVRNGGTVVGLNFATVDGNVATFVADNALALNGEYKVMAANATATYAFAEAGTIAFDTALFTPTYAITAAQGLDLSDATSGTVKTYTATAPAGWVDDSTTVSNQTAAAAYPALADSALANANAGELTDWATANSIAFATVAADTTGTYVDAFLLNCALADVATEKEEFVLNITIDENGNPVIILPPGKEYNGTLQLKGSADLSSWHDCSNNQPGVGDRFFKYLLSL